MLIFGSEVRFGILLDWVMVSQSSEHFAETRFSPYIMKYELTQAKKGRRRRQENVSACKIDDPLQFLNE